MRHSISSKQPQSHISPQPNHENAHLPFLARTLSTFSTVPRPSLFLQDHRQPNFDSFSVSPIAPPSPNEKSPDMILVSLMAASYVCGVGNVTTFCFCLSLSLSLSLSLLCCYMPIFDHNHLYNKPITLLPRLLVFVSVFSLVFVPIFAFAVCICLCLLSVAGCPF